MANVKLLVDIEANSAKLVSEVQKANKSLDGMKKSATDMQKSLSLISAASIVNLAQQAFQAAQQIYSFGRSIASAGNDIQRMSRVFNMTTDDFQKWSYVTKMADVDIEGFGQGFKFLTRSMSEALQGSGDAAKAFQILGINLKDSTGKTKDQQTVMMEVIGTLGKYADGVDRDALMLAIFGRGWMSVKPLVDQGTKAIEENRKEVERLNGILGKDTIRILSESEDAFKRWEAVWKASKISFWTPMIQTFTDLLEKILALKTALREGGFKELWEQAGRHELEAMEEQNWKFYGGATKSTKDWVSGWTPGVDKVKPQAPGLPGKDETGKKTESWTINAVISMLETEAEAKKALIELEKEWDKWLEGINKKLEEQNDLLIQSGIEGYAAVDKLNTEYAEEAEALGMTVYELERIREVLNQGVKDNEHFIDSLKEISTTWDDIGKEFSGTLTSNMSLLMSSTESWGEKFKKVGESILQTIMQIIAKQLVMNALFSDSKEGKGFLGGGSWVGSLIGGAIKGYQHGTDYVPKTGLAMLHQGEAVIPAGKTGGEGEGGTVIIMNIEATDVDSFERKYGGSVNKIFRSSARKGGAARKNMRSYI